MIIFLSFAHFDMVKLLNIIDIVINRPSYSIHNDIFNKTAIE